MMNRRTFALSIFGNAIAPAALYAQSFEVTRTDVQWRAMLTDLQYQVMRREATERSGTSPLDRNYGAGTYTCRGCDLALYASEAKFDSRTGWLSFFASLSNAIRTKEGNTLFSKRTECHCRRCGSHLGHIFNNGPAPIGKRHCLNGASLIFIDA